MPEQVIIEFIADTTGLQPAEDRLEALGKIDKKAATVFKNTNTELNKRTALLSGIADGSQKVVLSVTKEQSVYNKLVSSLKTLSGESKKTVQSLLQLNPSRLADGFNEINVSVDEYVKTLQVADGETESFGKSSITLKQELRSLTEQIAALKLNNEDAGESFNALVERAGKIKDAIGDAGSEIKNFSSDTRGIDNVIGSVQALAGGFAAAQGTVALFGDDNKELQETLVRVSASMAVLQGIQQLQNALQKEGAITLAILNAQTKVAVVQTQLLVAAQSQNVVVSGLATIATRVLNAAIAANPVGLFVTALVALVGVFAFFISRAKDAAVAQAELNDAIRGGTDALQASVDGFKRVNDKRISDLEKVGAKQSEIAKQTLDTEINIQNTRVDKIKKLTDVINKNRLSTNKETIELVGKAEEQLYKLEQDNQDSLVEIYKQTNAIRQQLTKEALENQVSTGRAILLQTVEGSKAQLAAQKALIRAQAELDKNEAGQDGAKRAAIEAQARKDIFTAEIAFQRRLLDSQKQALEVRLQNLATEDATLSEQHALRLKLINIETQQELANAQLSEKEKQLIRDKGFANRLEEDKRFNEESRRATLQSEIDKNNAVLAQREVSIDTQLALTLENIDLAAQLEIDSTKNNAAKIKEIIAQRDKDIRAARLANIQAELDYDLKLEAARTGVQVRANEDRQRVLGDEFGKRKISAVNYYNELASLVDENAKVELKANNKRLEALNTEFKDKLISQKDYNLQYAQLIDEQAKIVEDAEKRKRDAAKETKEDQKRKNAELISTSIDLAQQSGDIFFSLLQVQLDGQTAQIELEKKKIEELQKAGAISDKEALKRMNELAQRERRIKNEQAAKDKQAAIFGAIIATALAVTKALPNIPLSIIAGVLGAAQIALIASKPVPQFFRGKKKGIFQGWGQVAEHGPEAIERNDGSMYVQKDRGLVWLNKQDKVYTATETKKMLSERPVTRKTILETRNNITNNNINIDYEKIGKEVGKNVSTQVFIDGLEAQYKAQNSITNYLNNRRGG